MDVQNRVQLFDIEFVFDIGGLLQESIPLFFSLELGVNLGDGDNDVIVIIDFDGEGRLEGGGILEIFVDFFQHQILLRFLRLERAD